MLIYISSSGTAGFPPHRDGGYPREMRAKYKLAYHHMAGKVRQDEFVFYVSPCGRSQLTWVSSYHLGASQTFKFKLGFQSLKP